MNTIPPCMDRYRFVTANQPITPPPTSPGGKTQRFWDLDCPISNNYPTSQQSPYHVAYPQRMVHQNGPQYPMVYGNQGSASWTGVPLISTAQRRPRKYNNNSNTSKNEFDENAMSRLARHAHGAPLIVANRYRSTNGGKPNHQKKVNNMQPKEEILKCNNKSDSMSVTSDESVSSAGSHNLTNPSSTETLPRIIKPRKRRKKDRKPSINSNNSNNNVTDNQIGMTDNGQVLEVNNNNELTINNNNNNDTSEDRELFGTTSSLTSSCSCRLCDPFCKIWAFPLRRSCSDNSAEIELKKDVGVIGSHRHGLTRNEWRSSPQSLDLLQPPNIGPVSSNSSDSGDSGCDLLLSGLTFNDCSEFLIGDLTKKLNESFDLKSESDSGGSVFSENAKFIQNDEKNGDFFVNFDTMSRNNLFNVNNISNLSNLLFDDTIVANGLSPKAIQELNFFDKRERTNFDERIWREQKLLPTEE